MGQTEKKEVYKTCKELGLEVKWTMSEAALRTILNQHNETKEQEALDAEREKEQEPGPESEEVVDEPEAEDEDEDDYDDDEEVEVVFENGDDEEDIDQETPAVSQTPKAKPKVAKPAPSKREQDLKAKYFPNKKKSKSEDPYDIYNRQMNTKRKRKK